MNCGHTKDSHDFIYFLASYLKSCEPDEIFMDHNSKFSKEIMQGIIKNLQIDHDYFILSHLIEFESKFGFYYIHGTFNNHVFIHVVWKNESSAKECHSPLHELVNEQE